MNNYFIVGEGRWRELFLTNAQVFKLFTEKKALSPYTVGIGFGEFKKENIFLSLSGGAMLVRQTNKKVVVNQPAEQLFLYQRDVLCDSIVEMNQLIQQGDKVLVLNQKGDYLGIGKVVIPATNILEQKRKKELGIKNLIDLGWYLRKGQ
jgi:ribosome biogenesis protein Nip4